MPDKPKLENTLVVLGQELQAREELFKSALIQRAVAVARATGCALELFYVCYDTALDDNSFAAEEDMRELRQIRIDEVSAHLEATAELIAGDGIRVTHDVCWHSLRSDAILARIAESRPDLVMKLAGDHGFVLGITTNTEWELARRSPVHLWLVNDEVSGINRIVAAVGQEPPDTDDVTTSRDFHVLRIVEMIGKSFGAEIHPVNAYPAQSTFVAPGPVSGGTAPPAAALDVSQRESYDRTVKRHTSSVKALAGHFGIPRDRVHIREGLPSAVIPEVADSVSADMIAMGARSLTRLERFLGSVTVEPVMSEAARDILVVREPETPAASATDAA